jgi:hypothetical protein
VSVRQLPAAVPYFAGRAAELGRLTALAREQRGDGKPVVLAISGMAGVGKTALAVRWAHQATDWFPDGRLYVDLHGYGPSGDPVEPAPVLGRLLEVLGAVRDRVPGGLEDRARLYRSLLAGKRVLVVLDNARDEAQVQALLPRAAGCLAVVTSRAPLAGLAAREGAESLALDVMDDDDAASLFATRLEPGRMAAEPTAAAGLIGLCGRLPLALAIVSAATAARPAQPLAALADELRGFGDQRAGSDADEPTVSTRAVLSWSCGHLSAAAVRMLQLLSVHPGPDISGNAAVSLAGIGASHVRGALGELTSVGLLAEHVPGRYLLHDMVRRYAAERASGVSEDVRRSAASRLIDHYLHTANRLLPDTWRALDLGEPEAGVMLEGTVVLEATVMLEGTVGGAARPEGGMATGPGVMAGPADGYPAWFDAEYLIMLRLVGQAAANGRDPRAWQLAWTLTDFLDSHGYWDDWAAAQRAALAVACDLGDLAGQARASHSLGQACVQLRHHAEGHAYLYRALDLYERVQDREGQVHVHICRCAAAERQHRYRDALISALQALELLSPADDPVLRANTLNNLGACYFLTGDYQEALTWCARARDLYRELGASFGEANAWDSMAHTHQHMGQYAEADDCSQAARRLRASGHDEHRDAAGRPGDANSGYLAPNWPRLLL